jgi:tetratricopeptide (TPR) repeat protein
MRNKKEKPQGDAKRRQRKPNDTEPKKPTPPKSPVSRHLRTAIALAFSDPKRRESYVVLAVCGFLLLCVALIFGQTIDHQFINFDDNDYVYENEHVLDGLNADGVHWAFTTRHAANWHPLTWISHMLTCQIFGPGPTGQHLVNVLLHAAAAIFLFLALKRLTGRLWPSAFVAVLFAIHPLRVESVAWVAERKDVLSGLFFMLTLGAYAGYARRPSPIRYGMVVVWFVLGLMSKPMLVTTPFVLLLLDYWPLRRFASDDASTDVASRNAAKKWLRLIVEKIPLIILSGVSCAVTVWAQQEAVMPLKNIALSWRIGNAMVAYVAYLGQFFYPVGLAVTYPHPGNELSIGKAVAAAAFLAVLCGAAVVLRRRRPYMSVGWAWYLGMLVPAIGLMQVGSQEMADRYTYLPLIGIAIALTWGAADLCRTWPRRRWICGIASALLFTVLIGSAWRQTTYWYDNETLWHHVLACTSRNTSALNNLGAALYNKERFDDAMFNYQQVLKIEPANVNATLNIGAIYAAKCQYDKAIVQFNKVLKSKPNYLPAYYNLGQTHIELHQFEKAKEFYKKALAIDPQSEQALRKLIEVSAKLGQKSEVRKYTQQLAGHSAKSARTLIELGETLAHLGQTDEAIQQYKACLAILPNDVAAHYNLGDLYLEQNRRNEAIAEFESVLKLQPDAADAHTNLGILLALQGRFADAVTHYKTALAINPELPHALNHLAWLRATCPEAQFRNGAEAVQLAELANRICEGKQPEVLASLAAAYAETGNFTQALATIRKAVSCVSPKEQTKLRESLKEQIAAYEFGKPFRQVPYP